MVLDYVALGVIVFLMMGVTAVIVVIGSLPGKIANQRNHPWPAAVNTASWIGLATGVLWPLALIWAYLPVPRGSGNSEAQSPPATNDVQKLQQQLTELESTVANLKSQSKEGHA
jgi:hypothetical protein